MATSLSLKQPSRSNLGFTSPAKSLAKTVVSAASKNAASKPSTSYNNSTSYKPKTSTNQGFSTSSSPTSTATQYKATTPAATKTTIASAPNPAAKVQQAVNTAAANTGGSAAPPTFDGGSDPTFAGESGFAKSISQPGYQSMMSDPSLLTRAWFDYNNMDPDGGMMALMQQNISPSLLLYHTLFGDQNPGAGLGQWGPYADFSNQYMGNAIQPGGSYYTQQQIIDALSPNRKDSAPLVYQQLYEGMTPEQQGANYASAYGTAMAPTTANEVLNVQMAYLNSLRDEYTMLVAQGALTDMNFGEFLASKGWG